MSKDIFDDANVPESNWFKFEKVGDKVAGVVAENPTIKEDPTGEFGPQRVFKLTQEDGSVINVGISMKKDYIISRTNHVRQGDKVGFLFKEEIESQKKGYQPAKSIIPYVQTTEEGDAQREVEKSF